VGLLIPKLRLDDVEAPGQAEADFEEEMKADPRGSENEAADVDAGVRTERTAPARRAELVVVRAVRHISLLARSNVSNSKNQKFDSFLFVFQTFPARYFLFWLNQAACTTSPDPQRYHQNLLPPANY
jgi:hypothetical protein